MRVDSLGSVTPIRQRGPGKDAWSTLRKGASELRNVMGDVDGGKHPVHRCDLLVSASNAVGSGQRESPAHSEIQRSKCSHVKGRGVGGVVDLRDGRRRSRSLDVDLPGALGITHRVNDVEGD